MMRWRIERDASGMPCRMRWIGNWVCPWCNDRLHIYLYIPGARRLQQRPCPACTKNLNPIRWPGWMSPKPLEVQ